MMFSTFWRLLAILVPITAFLFTESSALGVWARYVHVDSCAETNVDIRVSLQNSSKVVINITFPEVVRTEDSWWSKRGWLISVKESFSKGYQSSFRRRLSDEPEKNSSLEWLESIELQKPTKSGTKYAEYNLEIPVDSLKGKYFYFGFTKEIADGGYYYTVDLETLVKNGSCEQTSDDT